MPTALPILYFVEIASPPKPIGSLRPVWLIVVWTFGWICRVSKVKMSGLGLPAQSGHSRSATEDLPWPADATRVQQPYASFASDPYLKSRRFRIVEYCSVRIAFWSRNSR